MEKRERERAELRLAESIIERKTFVFKVFFLFLEKINGTCWHDVFLEYSAEGNSKNEKSASG